MHSDISALVRTCWYSVLADDDTMTVSVTPAASPTPSVTPAAEEGSTLTMNLDIMDNLCKDLSPQVLIAPSRELKARANFSAAELFRES